MTVILYHQHFLLNYPPHFPYLNFPFSNQTNPFLLSKENIYVNPFLLSKRKYICIDNNKYTL